MVYSVKFGNVSYAVGINKDECEIVRVKHFVLLSFEVALWSRARKFKLLPHGVLVHILVRFVCLPTLLPL